MMPIHEWDSAHTLPGSEKSDWETLKHHVLAVSNLASDFASSFGASQWGALFGFWHDLGKASAKFQEFLCNSNDPDAAEESTRPSRVDHSTFGAQHALARMPDHRRQLLAFCIA